jgi:hypothetical protein
VSQTVVIDSNGARETLQSTGPTAVLTLLDQLGKEGWQLARVNAGMHGMKRRIEPNGGGWAVGV